LQNKPEVINPKVASFVLGAVEEIGRGSNPERSSTVASGTLTNIVITVSAAASLAALSAAAVASGSIALMVGTGATVLVVGEGLKKSKSFATVAALVTMGFDKASETEVAKAVKDISERSKPQLTFALKAEPWLRRLADQRDSGLKWVISLLDWIKHPLKEQFDQEEVGEYVDVKIERVFIERVFRDFDAGPEMIVVPAGEFLMGLPEGEGGARERPPHKVTIKNRFAVGISPVTRGEFAAFISATQYKIERGEEASWRDPGFKQKDDHPVVCVNWHDAQAYVAWMRERSGGKAYRLLSEAEWEYCCRAGTTSAYSTGDDITPERANFGLNSQGTTPVSRFPPNPWGLRDMHGNVWEWCEDNWHLNYKGAPEDGSVWNGGDASSRDLRGGSWDNRPHGLRSANRDRRPPDSRDDRVGFRVARTL